MWDPLPGDPDLVLASAAGLVARAAQLVAVVDALDGLATANWQTEAGLRFAERATAVPVALSALAWRYAEAGAALRSYAAVLADAQVACGLAARRRELALADVVALQREAASTGDPARRALLQRRVLEELAEVAAAERAYNSASGEHARADWACGERIEALTHDTLTDPATFRAIRYLGQGAGAVGLVGIVPSPVTTPLGVIAGGVVLGAHTILKVSFGYGSGRQLVGDAVAAALGGAGRTLRAGAVLTRPVGRELTFADRLAGGLKASQWTNAGWRFAATAPEPAAGPLTRAVAASTAASATRSTARAQALARARLLTAQAVDRRWATDWEVATSNGVVARRMLLAAWGAQEASRVVGRAGSADAPPRRRQDRGPRPGSW